MTRVVVCVSACILLSLLLVTAERATVSSPQQPAVRPPHRLHARRLPSSTGSPFSVFSVCDAEIEHLCPTNKEAPLKCLLQQFLESRNNVYASTTTQGHSQLPQHRLTAFSKECSSWLWGREECVSYVRMAGKCHASETARECLRRIPVRQLPPACRDTEYYHGVLLYGVLKRQRRQMQRDFRWRAGKHYR
ncbi:hypothetical protein DQ04_04301090 [Trypanosoma grayi]|uniref:hypothetical protein n=1 Tax=Trypanosoma grayi TaxID=71804 RepID=UPI0004F44D5B|nr:hypothetical protein DQ04_04301090 [Trypanosoma grayi]KEG10019.1 hypothetical protein DQ04_04301090 [Trypanosoma grayi]